MKRRWLSLLGWLLSVVAATTVGLLAVSLLSEGITGTSTTPLSNDAVAKALASATAAGTTADRSSSPTTTPDPPPTNTDRARALGSPGGTVIARCDGTRAYLLSWSPAQGWTVEDELIRGPARSTLVKFEGDRDSNDDQEVTVTVTCQAGRPVAASVSTND